MEFRRIEYFLVLADKLNYAKAARELCISSQALTKQINILEEELGTKLFNRTTRYVELTEDGLMCRIQFSNLKAQYDATLAAVEKAIRSRKKVVKISFFSALPKNKLMVPLIYGLSTQYPDVDFQISTNNMDGLRDQVKDGEVDLVITNAHDFEDWRGCDTIVFKVTPAQIVVSQKNTWVREGKKEITAADMADADILLLVKHGPYEFNSFYSRAVAKSRSLVPTFDAMMIELEKGKKFGVFPMFFNDAENSNYVCFDLPDEYRFNFRTMCACRSANKNPDVRKVFEYIKKCSAHFDL